MSFEQARDSMQRKRASGLLEALKRKVPSGSPVDAQGYFLKGLTLEFGVDGEVDFSGAIKCYRMASHLSRGPDSFPFLGIARVLMKQGPENHGAAFDYIKRASAANHTPEVDLAFATYYEMTEQGLDLAKHYYLKAAIKGRFAGFFGLAYALRRTGHNVQAVLVDVVRLFVGPMLFIVLGRTARSSFNGY